MIELAEYHSALKNCALFKRFNERWVADPHFRAAMAADPTAALSRYRIPPHSRRGTAAQERRYV